jgi:glycosyltransferase involved in cell wall biosynthesis
MITVVLTNRNRDLKLVKRCLVSLHNQSNKQFKLVVVDYGSSIENLECLEGIIEQFPEIELISCDTSRQLWCKSRALNIVLKTCETSHFFVGDIDMIYHREFIEKLHQIKDKADATYFQVGFLSEKESKNDKNFDDYKISFKSTEEATGMTLYNTEVLKSINSYDEFYHGWGSEDTDVHLRLKNANKQVLFYSDSILMLHQWHPKTYRSKDSTEPFHSYLEKINQKYLYYTKVSKKVKANTNFDWGLHNTNGSKDLKNIDVEYGVTNELADFKGFVSNVLLNTKNQVISVTINTHQEYKSLKQAAKKALDKKVLTFADLQSVNDMLLETLIVNCRNAPYQYNFNRKEQYISLIIKL